MWPWEHLAVGYLLYSASARARGRVPSENAALAAALGTQFPDLVDKPLSWTLDVLPAGVLSHSVFVALPLVGVVLLVARRVGRPEPAIAFGIGYLAHLPGDVVPSLVFESRPRYWFLLWPAVPRPGVDVSDPIVGPGAGAGLLTHAAYYFEGYVGALLGPRGALYVAVELAVLLGAVALWLRDGRPGVATLAALVRSRRETT
ncbi:metal-dependent hydrolase [Halobacteriales archaeon QS_4_69_34]|nr:MAG: metal-dependent hydrolase [Halobacteriales archaeon QS_4_69_34]